MKGLINRLKIYSDFISRRPRLSGLPVEIGIELTNRCNLKCPFCAREEMTRPEGDMPMDLFRKIIDDAKVYAEMVYLHGDGEPFLHKNVFEAISYAKNNRLRVGISTNATTLNAKNANILIESGIDYLIMAMDGITKETYEKLRVNARFEQVIENIKNFLELNHKTGSKIFTIMQFIEMPENRHETREFYAYWKRHKPNVIRIKPYVDLVRHDRRANFKLPCFYLWRSSMIDWDGTVFPCCVDTNSKHRMGNISEKSLSEIWNSEHIVEMRRKHVEGKMREIDICRTCDMPMPNSAAVLGVSLVNGFWVKKFLPYVENLKHLYMGVFNRSGLSKRRFK